jgi:formylglycine-generating enzyme required for sulfatase activity
MRYPWGNTVNCGQAAYGRYWEEGECLGYGGLPDMPQQVMSYGVNGYGLYDTAGNVSEWVNDLYGATYYSSSPVNDPPGPTTGFNRVYRGGSWVWGADMLRVADRNGASPSPGDFSVGFRCAR